MSIALQEAPPEATHLDPPSTLTPMSVTVLDRLYRLTVDQYQAMAGAGILVGSDRIELIEGLLVTKMTKHQPHIIATGLTQDILTRVVTAGWFVEMQDPITIDDLKSQPEPDAKVVRGTRRDYLARRVTPADVALVVEVADSSLPEDQTSKKRLYAHASIPVFWLLNLPANRLEVYSNPTGPDPSPDYRLRSDHGPEDSVPLILDGREVARIAVRDLLP